MGIGADPHIRLQIVCDDPLLTQRLAAASRRYGDIRLAFSGSIPSLQDWDVLVLRADFLFDALREPQPGDRLPGLSSFPVICYGAAAFLEASFLAGCRDYLRDPWAPDELFLRVRRLNIRRPVRFGELEIDLAEGIIRSSRRNVLLSAQERSILSVLARNAGSIVPREAFFLSLWGGPKDGSRVLDMHVSSIRKKLARMSETGSGRDLIETCRGKGYRLRGSFDSVPTRAPDCG